MPQMAPLMWLTLFFLFTLLFILFNMLNYFNFSLNLKKNKKNYIKNFNYMAWLW